MMLSSLSECIVHFIGWFRVLAKRFHCNCKMSYIISSQQHPDSWQEQIKSLIISATQLVQLFLQIHHSFIRTSLWANGSYGKFFKIFRTLVVSQKGQDKQRRSRSDCFWRSSLIRVFPVCFSDKHFVMFSFGNQQFIRNQREKCLSLSRC